MIFIGHRIVRTLLPLALVMLGASAASLAQKEAGPAPVAKIVECIRNEDVVCVSQFLAKGGDANAVDDKGVPLLVIASETKSATVVRLLLNAGADVSAVGSGDGTPLCQAALFARKEIAQTLLDAGAKANVICDSYHGDSALMEALRGAWFAKMPNDLKEMLFRPEDTEEGGDDRVARLRQSMAESSGDYLDIARMLIARGADLNVVAKCDVGESALMYASMAADVEMVRTLLTNGADAKEESNLLGLLWETEREYRQAKLVPVPTQSRQQAALVTWIEQTRTRREEIARLLKAAGAKEPERGEEETDPAVDPQEYVRQAFSDVIEQNDLKDFERLVDAYAKHPLGAAALPDALRSAVIYSRPEMVKLLLERGVSPNPTADKYTPLMQAASSANFEIVKLLLDAGADLNAQDEKGRTALDEVEMYTSSSESHRKMSAFLKERGARSGKDLK